MFVIVDQVNETYQKLSLLTFYFIASFRSLMFLKRIII